MLVVAALLHGPVPTSSSLWRPGTIHNTWESQQAVGVVTRGGGGWGGEIGVAGRPRLAPTCGEVCVRQSAEQMRALSPVIFHIFFILNKTKTMWAGEQKALRRHKQLENAAPPLHCDPHCNKSLWKWLWWGKVIKQMKCLGLAYNSVRWGELYSRCSWRTVPRMSWVICFSYCMSCLYSFSTVSTACLRAC